MAGSPLRTRVRNRAERLRQRGWRLARYRSNEPHIVMGGAPRSGTTVLRKLLDRHPDVCAGPETKLFVPAAFNLEWLAHAYAIPLDELRGMRAAAGSQGAFIDAFAKRVLAACGKGRWAEKTPMNIRYLDWILARFPRAAVVHIIRDGRDVVCSMRQHPDWRWVGGAWQKVLVPRSIATYAERWMGDTALGMAWRDDARYVEVRYEDLVADPAGVLRHICESVGLPAPASWLRSAGKGALVDPAGLAAAPRREPDGPDSMATAADDASGSGVERPDYEGAVSGASVGRWRTDLDPGEQAEVTRRLRRRLLELGYEV